MEALPNIALPLSPSNDKPCTWTNTSFRRRTFPCSNSKPRSFGIFREHFIFFLFPSYDFCRVAFSKKRPDVCPFTSSQPFPRSQNCLIPRLLIFFMNRPCYQASSTPLIFLLPRFQDHTFIRSRYFRCLFTDPRSNPPTILRALPLGAFLDCGSGPGRWRLSPSNFSCCAGKKVPDCFFDPSSTSAFKARFNFLSHASFLLA